MNGTNGSRAASELSTAAEALLAAAWCLPSAALAGFLATQLGVWKIPPATTMLLGSPAVLLAGRAVFWGLTLSFLFRRMKLLPLILCGVWLDRLLFGVVRVESANDLGFWVCEVFALAACLVPAHLFVHWTRERKHLATRNVMHLLFHGALFIVVYPMVLEQITGGNFRAAAERSSALNKIELQLLAIPCVLLLTAMQEFHARGRGTPMPGDAPRHLVTSGIYAYVANPMQIGKFGVLLGWSLFWRNPWISGVAAIGLFYSLTVARLNEDRDLGQRFGGKWLEYRQHVPRWLPRWKPWIPNAPVADSATLYLDLACGPCAHLARWFAVQRPTALRVLSLGLLPQPTRMTYRSAQSGPEFQGMAALARGLEHVNLAWAFCGWMLRLPPICWLADMIADAVGPWRAEHCRARQHPTGRAVLDYFSAQK